MTELRAVCDTLEACEKQMRAAISEAAAAAEPERLNQLVRWLGEIQRIGREACEQEGTAAPTVKATSTSIRRPSTGSTVNRRAKTAAAYPRFFADGDALVKVGWSRKSHEEYEHKASKSAVSAVAAALAEAGRGGLKIVMEKVMPVHDKSGSTIPDYQVYVALAWLRALDLVLQHGRQGYTLARGQDFQQAVDRAWSLLEQR